MNFSLRTMRNDDVARVLNLHTPEDYRLVRQSPTQDRRDALTYHYGLVPDTRVICTPEDGVIGTVTVRRSQLGFWIAEPFRGRGYATAALANYFRLWARRQTHMATCWKHNIASAKTLARAGFEETARGGEVIWFFRFGNGIHRNPQ